MTIITVTTLENRLSQQQRRVLAESLTDAVLVPEVGHAVPAARVGFDEGSWGSRGRVLSILELLASGVFTPERIAEIRKAQVRP